jgi:hypothetical protein
MPQLPDTSNAEPGDDNSFEPITEGSYKLKIVKFKQRTTKKNTIWLKVWFKTDGFPGFIWGDISLNPDKLRKLKEFKLALGLSDSPIDMDELVGRELWGHCCDDGGYASVDRYSDTEQGLESDDDLPF